MRTFLLCLTLNVFLCNHALAQGGTDSHWISGDLAVRPIADGVWLHTTFRDLEGFGRVPSNGLLVVAGGEALLIDTAWGEAPTEALLTWIADSLGLTVTRAIITHGHDDRMGGFEILRRAGVRTYALAQTADLGAEQGWPRPDSALAGLHSLPVGNRRVEAFYPGPGHTPDNVVVWIPEQRVLFGGCLIRPGDGQSLGNLSDAVVGEWAPSVVRVRDRYGAAAIVVPAHGLPGDAGLLDHTLRLIEVHPGAR